MREAFPAAGSLRELSRVVASTSAKFIREAGFDVVDDPTRKFPNHVRLVHPDGATGFSDENLARLSASFEIWQETDHATSD
jgi:hypothetical protein